MTEIIRDTTIKVPLFEKAYAFDGATFTVRLNYNRHNDSWYMTLYDSDGAVVIASLRLYTGAFILRNKRAHPSIPAGDFKVIQASTDGTILIDYDNFGDEFKLYYYDADEVEY